MKNAPDKWRPSIVMVVAVICLSLISIPLLALLGVRLTSNQFVRETEQSLIQQAAIYAERYAEAFSALDGPPLGNELSEAHKEFWNADFHPLKSQLNIRHDKIAAPRPDGEDVAAPLDPRYDVILPPLIKLARGAKRTTLAGVVFLDHSGRDLSSQGAPSLAALPEVQKALVGEIGAALRSRGNDKNSHPFASLSRDTNFRVFVTYPVISRDRVIGAIYLSRTPLNLGKFLFQERYALLLMLISTVTGAAIIGLFLFRLISRPIYALRDASHAVAAKQGPYVPLKQYGLRELAEMGDSVSTMAGTLSKRSQEIATYADHVTHELKSPVTAIMGAAELLQDDALDAKNRTKLLSNIEAEAARMNRLLSRLREATRMRSSLGEGPGALERMLPDLDGLTVMLDADSSAMLPLSEEHGKMVLLQMAQNARAHGAQELRISFANSALQISDNGEGINQGDIARLTDPFFTTRRDQGGTGMGLAIVSAILEIYNASLECLPNDAGASFMIHFEQ